MVSERVQRINELVRKQKSVGLTDEEKLEQAELRRQYIDDMKASLRVQLESIEFVDEDRKED